MERKVHNRLILAVGLLAVFSPSFAQRAAAPEKEENLIRLVKASSIGLEDHFGQPFRKAVDATFLHNGTYLKCDTALWDVNGKLINSWGNVRLTQGKVVLTSEKMDYDIERSQAKFRGAVVEVKDDKNNILRTVTLDYNTKDSLGIFHDGGSMCTEDGMVIESDHGYYNTPAKLVNFLGEVNMYTDTVYLRTKALDYNTASKTAFFVRPVDFWREGDMLSSNSGWYEKESETFFFEDNVHGTSAQQEAWCDSMYFYRVPKDVLMLGRAQMQDTVKHTVAVGEYMLYESALKQLTLYDNAAVAIRTEHDNKVDTLYCGADTLIYNAVKFGLIPDSLKTEAAQRLEDISIDAVGEYRKKASEEAAAAAKKAEEEKASKQGGKIKRQNGPAPAETASPATAPADSAAAEMPADSLGTGIPDSLSAVVNPVDSAALAAEKMKIDSTDVGFIYGRGNVRLFREDIQMRCDSVVYCDLDSIARFFIEPVIWNEGNRQYSSDSIFVLVKNGTADRASLMSNAMIITQEDSICFDQIKSTEVMAFFNDKTELTRFDALGTANAVFFLEENGALATANVVESKMFSGTFKDGELHKVHYFDSPKNDAYPVVQLPKDYRRLKGFNWKPEERPASREDVTTLEVKPSEREAYASHRRPVFRHTENYFPGCMDGIRRGLALARERRDSISRARDSIAMAQDADTLAVEDQLKVAASDTAVTSVPADSLTTPAAPASSEDSIGTLAPTENKVSAAELRRAEAKARKEARWKELDRKDAERKAAKEKRELEKKRRKTLKLLRAQQRQDASDERKLQRYIRMYERQKARQKNNGKVVE